MLKEYLIEKYKLGSINILRNISTMEICKHFINSDNCFRLIVKTDLSKTRKILEIHKKANTTKDTEQQYQNGNPHTG